MVVLNASSRAPILPSLSPTLHPSKKQPLWQTGKGNKHKRRQIWQPKWRRKTKLPCHQPKKTDLRNKYTVQIHIIWDHLSRYISSLIEKENEKKLKNYGRYILRNEIGSKYQYYMGSSIFTHIKIVAIRAQITQKQFKVEHHLKQSTSTFVLHSVDHRLRYDIIIA
jgi:hypothetical protein